MSEADLSELTAAPLPVTIAGKEYHASPLTLSCMGEFERWCRGEMIRTAAEAFADAKPSERQEAIREATRASSKMAFHTEEAGYMASTAAGMHRVVWLSLRIKHPGVTLAMVNDLGRNDLAGFGAAFSRIMRASNPESDAAEGRAGGKPEAETATVEPSPSS